MKKIKWLLVLGLALLVDPRWAAAYNIYEFTDSLSLTAFKLTARAGHYYDFISENSKISAMKDVVRGDCISLDVGVATRYFTSEKATFLAGGTLYVNELIGKSFPEFTKNFRQVFGASGQDFLDHAWFGIAGGWDSERAGGSVGINAGIQFGNNK